MRRRTLLTGLTAGLLAVRSTDAFATGRRVLHVRPGDSVQAAVDAVTGPGRTIVVHPGTYREVVNVPADKAELTIRGASRDPRDAVIVYDNANGTKKPDAGFLAGLNRGRGVAALGFSLGAYRAWQTAALSDAVSATAAVCWMTGLKDMLVPGNNTLRGQSSYYHHVL